MKFADKIKPLSDLKKNTTQILDQIKITQSPVIITKNGQATAVLQDIESYEKTKQAFLLLKGAGWNNISISIINFVSNQYLQIKYG